MARCGNAGGFHGRSWSIAWFLPNREHLNLACTVLEDTISHIKTVKKQPCLHTSPASTLNRILKNTNNHIAKSSARFEYATACFNKFD